MSNEVKERFEEENPAKIVFDEKTLSYACQCDRCKAIRAEYDTEAKEGEYAGDDHTIIIDNGNLHAGMWWAIDNGNLHAGMWWATRWQKLKALGFIRRNSKEVKELVEEMDEEAREILQDEK